MTEARTIAPIREGLAREFLIDRGAHLIATDQKAWEESMRHYYVMVAKYPEYAGSGGLITNAMRDAQIAIAYLRSRHLLNDIALSNLKDEEAK